MRRILVTGLLSSLAFTAAAATVHSSNDSTASASAPASARPVSTGVTNPQLVYSTRIQIPAEEVSAAFPNPARVVLRLNLDQTGSPKAIHVIQPLSQSIDARVVEAVRQFRWSPAVLDNQPISSELNLIVQVAR